MGTFVELTMKKSPSRKKLLRWPRGLVWTAGALVGAILAVILAPVLLDRRGTPDRLRSREDAERAMRNTTAPNLQDGDASLRYRSDSISVQFKPVEADPGGDEGPSETDSNRPSWHDDGAERKGAVQ